MAAALPCDCYTQLIHAAPGASVQPHEPGCTAGCDTLHSPNRPLAENVSEERHLSGVCNPNRHLSAVRPDFRPGSCRTCPQPLPESPQRPHPAGAAKLGAARSPTSSPREGSDRPAAAIRPEATESSPVPLPLPRPGPTGAAAEPPSRLRHRGKARGRPVEDGDGLERSTPGAETSPAAASAPVARKEEDEALPLPQPAAGPAPKAVRGAGAGCAPSRPEVNCAGLLVPGRHLLGPGRHCSPGSHPDILLETARIRIFQSRPPLLQLSCVHCHSTIPSHPTYLHALPAPLTNTVRLLCCCSPRAQVYFQGNYLTAEDADRNDPKHPQGGAAQHLGGGWVPRGRQEPSQAGCPNSRRGTFQYLIFANCLNAFPNTL